MDSVVLRLLIEAAEEAMEAVPSSLPSRSVSCAVLAPLLPLPVPAALALVLACSSPAASTIACDELGVAEESMV